MSKADRRALARDYKERRTIAGVYALRCAASGEAWVGGSRNIDAQANSTFFSLRSGGHPNTALQAAWKAHGEGLVFDVLERIDDPDLTPTGVADEVKSRTARWLAELGAKKAVG